MCENLFSSIIEISLSSSIIILTLLLITPFIKKRYVAKWRYILWLILTIRLIIPFNFTLPNTPVKLVIPSNTLPSNTLPSNTLSTNQPINNQNIISLTDLAEETRIQKTSERIHSYSLTKILSSIWLIGAVLFIFRIIIIYSIFHKKMVRNSDIVTNDNILLIFNQLCVELNIKKPRIRLTNNLCSPMMYGFIRPTLFLSDKNITKYDLEVILRHELIHYKRHDLLFKLLLTLANAIHWFNPFVYLMVKSAHKDIEFSCDDEVIKNFDMAYKKLYSQAILNSLKEDLNKDVVLSTQFKGGKKMMKQRFSNILNTTKKRKGKISLCFITLCIMISGLLIACTQTNTNEKEPEKNISNNQPVNNTAIENPQQEDELVKENTVRNVLYEYDVLGFSIELPAEWNDKIGINVNYVETCPDGGARIEVYHKAIREASPDQGTLFYIDRWLGTWTETAPPLQDGQSSIVLQTKKYTYMLRTPIDSQYNENDSEMVSSYKSMFSQIDTIKSSVKELNPRPSSPNAGYQSEAEFLSSPDGVQFRVTAFGAARGVLTGDANELKKYLINPSDAIKLVNSFSDYQVDLIRFECQFILDAIKSDDKIVTSYLFTPVGKDVNKYVSMELKKVNGEWLVDWLGAEQ
ncbi:M56 family metallopeptidase [Lachnoclostridium phytofermentans]|uniref:Peptidase M56 BlaR1 n=1 Tax=Lachnoclostridium phytofermentans (strain ATCC 700394 / DSM 18823 / ISDg) TaxID=357809 RepID=A9KII4_LACP7|nr:M56 family metallopeptidase [Lachnoclostridium phytofermentans]ABX42436.1 peptidase M56 BlaR1 [Lachnoclostridium phytofermentans ISDg]